MILLVLAAVLTAPAPAPTPVVLTDFFGLRPVYGQPDAPPAEITTAELLRLHYPARALEREADGRSAIECEVGPNRDLVNCVVVEESPAELGFGTAALRAATRLRFKEDRQLAPGTRVRLPTLWTLARAKPVWKRQPTAADLAAAYPEAARSASVAGEALLKCRVTDKGGLANCATWLESHPGLGFGEAAIGLAPKFEAKPKSAEGRPIAGQVVNVTIRWNVD